MVDLGTTALRGIIGTLFVGHGAQKLFGWFGGHGIEGTGGFFESLGLRPGKRHAIAAGTAETVGGALLATGTLSPVAAAMLNGTMVTAMRTAHKGKGPWATDGGWEYPLVLIAAVTALADREGGRTAAAFALGAGLAGSYLATAERFMPPVPEPEPQTAEDATREESGRFTSSTEQTADEPAATTL